MVRVCALVLLLLAGSVSYGVRAEAATTSWPKLKGLFQKKGRGGKLFKQKKRNTKYYHAAAKKQRKAKWQRHSRL